MRPDAAALAVSGVPSPDHEGALLPQPTPRPSPAPHPTPPNSNRSKPRWVPLDAARRCPSDRLAAFLIWQVPCCPTEGSSWCQKEGHNTTTDRAGPREGPRRARAAEGRPDALALAVRHHGAGASPPWSHHVCPPGSRPCPHYLLGVPRDLPWTSRGSPLYLLTGQTVSHYRAIEEFFLAGKARAIGISNFNASQIDALFAARLRVPPRVNQCGFSIGGHYNASLGRDLGTLAKCKVRLHVTTCCSQRVASVLPCTSVAYTRACNHTFPIVSGARHHVLGRIL